MTLVTLNAGPRNVVMRLVVSRLRVPLCASAFVLATISLPVRENQPSRAPLSNVAAAPSVLPGGPGGGATCVMLKLSM